MGSQMPIRRGVHRPLEDAADALIKQSLKGVTRHSEKSDILTPWKEQERKRREVLVPSGSPDASVRSGIFHRVINTARPELNSRDGIVRGRRINAHATFDERPEGAATSYDWDSE